MKTIFGYIVCSLAVVGFCAVVSTTIGQPVQGQVELRLSDSE